jgi:outer membrane protein assembly factor BamB
MQRRQLRSSWLLAHLLAVVVAFTGCGEPSGNSVVNAPTAPPTVSQSNSPQTSVDSPTLEDGEIAPPANGKRLEVPVAAPFARVKVARVKVAPANWPVWRGPNADGIARETDWHKNWNEKPLPELWSTQLGIGFSSMAVVGDKVYTMGHVDGEDFVYCLNADTGKTVWQHKYPCLLVDNLHEGGPGATPTVDGDRVYTLGREGQFFCFDRGDGEIKWEKNLAEDLEIRMPEWGFTSSALVVNDEIILEAGRVVSYKKLTGEKVWETEKYRPGYGAPALFEHQGEQLLAVLNCDGLLVVKKKNGEEVDFQKWDSPFGTNSTTPIPVGDKIYVSSGYNVGCGLFQLKEGKLDLLYNNRDMRNHFNNSVLLDGYLYGFDGNSNLGRVVRVTCMNFESGEVAWQKAGYGCGSVLIADGELILLSDDGRLVLAKATKDGLSESASQQILEGRCWTVPVLAAKRFYCRNAAGHLVCLDANIPNDGQTEGDNDQSDQGTEGVTNE